MKLIQGKTFQKERELYGETFLELRNCHFQGEEDGESHLKEAYGITLDDCSFSLRYPLWHNKHLVITNTKFNESSRAPIWYSNYVSLSKCEILSVKAIRECSEVNIIETNVISEEFAWKSNQINVLNSSIEGFYAFFESKNITLMNVEFKGKYSFQYVEDVYIDNSRFDTKDAFWHAKRVHIKNSIIQGEYFGWYSEDVTLENCTIIGTQPFCYCERLVLIDCELIGADRAFEYSDVNATLKGKVESIKNPRFGQIIVDEVGEVILENSKRVNYCKIITK